MKRPAYFDIHSHCNDSRFNEDRERIIGDMLDEDIWTITVGTNRNMSKLAAEMTLLGDGVFASVGVHPVDNPDEGFDAAFYSDLLLKYPKIVAVGECGLDYFRIAGDGLAEKKRQSDLFEQQIEFAVQNKLPLMIHVRGAKGAEIFAHNELIDLVTSKKREYGDALRGNIHFFSGDIVIAKKYFELDFTISITGVITFTHDYDEVIRYAPANLIMAETDAPYVAPVPYRGKRNVPLYIKEVSDQIAAIRKQEKEALRNLLVDNALRFFAVSEKIAKQ